MHVLQNILFLSMFLGFAMSQDSISGSPGIRVKKHEEYVERRKIPRLSRRNFRSQSKDEFVNETEMEIRHRTFDGEAFFPCLGFEAIPRNPSDKISEVTEPWEDSRFCKLFITRSDSNGKKSYSVCSGFLVGPFHLMTARHCSYKEGFGNADSIEVACGYGFYENATRYENYKYFGSSYISRCSYYSGYDRSVDRGKTDQTLDIQICKLDRDQSHIGWLGTTSTVAYNLEIEGYPGDQLLDVFIANASDRKYWRTGYGTVDENGKQISLEGTAWVFGGESGTAYYRNDLSSDGKVAVAVHTGVKLDVGKLVDSLQTIGFNGSKKLEVLQLQFPKNGQHHENAVILLNMEEIFTNSMMVKSKESVLTTILLDTETFNKVKILSS